MTLTDRLKRLGEDLLEARKKRRMSLANTALPARISAAYLQKLERGLVKNPSPRVLHRLSGVLALSYPHMMEQAGYVMPATNAGEESPQSATAVGMPDLHELSGEERRAVMAFVDYLKAQRP